MASFMRNVGAFFGLISEQVPEQPLPQKDDYPPSGVRPVQPSFSGSGSTERTPRVTHTPLYDRGPEYDNSSDDSQPTHGHDNGRRDFSSPPTSQGGKILHHPSASTQQQPALQRLDFRRVEHYQDVYDIIDLLLDGVVVDINTELLRAADAQRVLDALSGSAYAMDARLRRTGQNVYQLAPNSVIVTGSYDDGDSSRSPQSVFRRD